MAGSVIAKPSFSLAAAVAIAQEFFNLNVTATELPGERDQNFKLTGADGTGYVLKFSNWMEEPEVLDLQEQALAHIATRDPHLPCPRHVPGVNGQTVLHVPDHSGARCFVRALHFLPGEPLGEIAEPGPDLLVEIGRILGRLDVVLQDFAHPAMFRDLRWDLKQGPGVTEQYLEYIADEPGRQVVADIRQEFLDTVTAHLNHLRHSVIHGDANDFNILISGDNVSGLIDFGDMVYTPTVCEPAIAAAYVMLNSAVPLAAAAQLIAGYNLEHPLTDLEIALLYPLIRMRLATSVALSAFQRAQMPGNDYLAISERAAWALLKQLENIKTPVAESLFRLACNRQPGRAGISPRSLSPETLLAARQKYLGPSLSLAYQEPLKIVRGAGQYLYDEAGRAYLDCVNNVCSVGHSHPRVVAAAGRQMSLLNTNTRYLHDNIVAYAARLTALLPTPLQVCYFVCSGSEANELALRLAWSYTGRKDVIVLDGAYHGNTSTLVDISPYKHNGPGGQGAPPYVHAAPTPDPYRGLFKGYEWETGRQCAALVRNIIRQLPAPGPAAFICESLLSCGGQIVLPDGFLAEVYADVRQAGGVCIADEVQVGFGRVGSRFWGFELQGVTPDIVTMGKPIGNGHPLAAVVTTPEIAAAFANGMEYFNTFGGNPVSCAVGLAVLDVIQSEGLQTNALRVGEFLLRELAALAERHALIGDVRGSGLFLGIELVRNRLTLEPAALEATEVVERMKERGILLSTDGPLHNVIKIKPPLVFDIDNARQLVSSLDEVLNKVVAVT